MRTSIIQLAVAASTLMLASCCNPTPKDYEPGISLSLCSGSDIPTEEQLQEIKDAGVEWVEVIMNPLTRNVSEEEGLQRALTEKALLDKVGLKVWSCHLPYGRCKNHNYDISVLDSLQREDALEQDARMIELSRMFAPQRIVLHPSAEPVPAEERQARLQNSKESIGVLAAEVAKTGAVLCVECLPRTCLGNSSAEILFLIGDYPDVRVTFDLNHLIGESHQHFFEVIGDKIAHIHASEYDGVDEKHWLPGCEGGVIDWPGIVAGLRGIGYEGVFMHEVRNGDNVCAATIAKAYREVICEGR